MPSLAASPPGNQTLHSSPCEVLHARIGNLRLHLHTFGRCASDRQRLLDRRAHGNSHDPANLAQTRPPGKTP